MPHLFIVATPIGNLKDISSRALETLQSVDLILAEDTRVTSKLLQHYNISTPAISYHQHSTIKKINQVKEYLKENKKIALVSDAGTPGISDPGNVLISELLKDFETDLQIIPIPGANAAITTLSISGFPTDNFIFLGFPPHKKGRETFFKKLKTMEQTIVFYESVHRIEKALESIIKFLPDSNICLGRELTKMHETIYRGKPDEVLLKLQRDQIKGEFVVVISK